MCLLSLSDKCCSSVVSDLDRSGRLRKTLVGNETNLWGYCIAFYFLLFSNPNANVRAHGQHVWCLWAALNLRLLYLMLLNGFFTIHTHTTSCECSLWLSFTWIDSIYSFSHLAVDAMFTGNILCHSSVFFSQCGVFAEIKKKDSKLILVFICYNSHC